MEYTISGVTWLWMFIPMPLVILSSIITLFTEGRGK